MSEEKQNIENFFSKKLDSTEFPFDEAQWSSLERKLEKELPVSRNHFTKYLTLVLLAILAFTIGWLSNEYFSNNTDDINNKKTTNSQISTSENEDDKHAYAQKNNLEQPNADVASNKNISAPVSTKDRHNSTLLDEYDKSTPIKPISSPDNSNSESLFTHKSLDNNLPEVLIQILKRLKSKAPVIHSLNKTGLKSVFPAMDEGEQATPNAVMKRRVWVGVIFSPDFSNTAWNTIFNKAGFTGGVQWGYQITDRWMIGTSFLLSNKRYTAPGDDYNPESGFWNYGETPVSADAICLILDVPLNLAYRINRVNANNNFWISASVSNSWMLTEEYQYQYTGLYNSALIDGWKGRGESSHLLSHLGFSIQWHHQFNEKLGFLVSPYVNLPLKGVGHGNVHLMSSGLMLGINHKF